MKITFAALLLNINSCPAFRNFPAIVVCKESGKTLVNTVDS